MQFSENVAGNGIMTAQFIRQKFEAPTDIPVPVQRADATIFTVDQRLVLLFVTGDVIEIRTREVPRTTFSMCSLAL